ncbi:MAG: T9SS type A sorting domain-containing protein [Bacteroidetes bacterium]|nr:T9SS type A sorting domain-containing protein [Bacteroidota bacterium]
MKKLIIVLMVLFAAQNIFAQSGWFVQYRNDSLSEFTKIVFPDSVNGYAFRPGGLFKTTNSGINWVRHDFINNNFSTAEFLNKYKGLSVGSNIASLIRTSDGGLSWDSIYTFPNTIRFIKFKDSNTVFVCCNESIYKSSNGGNSWNLVLNAFYVGSKNHSIIFTDSLVGYMASPSEIFIPFSTYQTIVYKTIDGGNSWSNISYLSNIYFSQMKFINENTGFASTLYSGILKTTNSGVNWFPIYYNSQQFNFIEIVQYNKIYIPGFASPDGGINWYAQNLNTINPIYFKSAQFINNNTGFIVGGGPNMSNHFAFIFKTTDGGGITGITYINSNVSDHFSLSQNYPNPFNPSTVILYQLSVAGFTTLKVFDLLGKEVAMLVNQKQNAGSYAVDFNSSEFNLPSGIYFYTLNAGEFKETKKMILIK